MKLSKLVVTGFKSFADRTEFHFDDGISCIVGPNGCGKSNVVDAVKWVLGEQSAKSLRGAEMADVIFNGSAARRAGGMAEVTLVFEGAFLRAAQPAASDGEEGDAAPAAPPSADGVVSVARRLYRSGQSEYLVNGTPCRLRDIREMFMDTGVGADAYSLIEQGRVESFLQASQEERRAIFDEAAGISKYKARRKEALRKIERVEQDLLRLHDVLGEVEKRLRSIKYQAGKARSYQTYAQRLKELRSLHFLAQYHELKARREELTGRHDAATDRLAAVTARIEQLEAAQSAAEVEAVDLERAARDLQANIAAVGGQVVTCQERADMLAARAAELDRQVLAALARCEELEAKIETAQQQRAERQGQLDALAARSAELDGQVRAGREAHAAAELEIARLEAAVADEKAGTIDLLRRTAQIHNEIHGLGIRREGLHTQKSRLEGRAEEIRQALRDLLTERAEQEARLADVRELIDSAKARLAESRRAGEQAGSAEQQLRAELAEAREQRSALAARADALGQMQQRLEGVAAGARSVLAARREGRCRSIRGMLAEMVQADSEHAAIVEAALGGADQQLIAADAAELAADRDELAAVLAGGASVEIVCLDRLAPLRLEGDSPACPALPRAIDFVRCEAPAAPLIWRLLGETYVAPDLAAALAAARRAGPSARFVTPAGEVVEGDGRVRFGAGNRAAGIILRRSELARLEHDRRALEERIEQLQLRCRAAQDELKHLEEVQQQLRTAVYEANTERVAAEAALARLDEQVAALHREQPVVTADVESLAAEIESAVRAEHDARHRAEELEELNRQRQGQVEELERRIAEARAAQERRAETMMELKVAQAAADEQRRSAREALEAMSRQAEQMSRDLAAQRDQIELDRQRKADAEAGVAAARGEVDRLYERQQQLHREAAELDESRRGLQERLEETRRQLGERRKEHGAAADELNACKVEMGEADVRIETVIARAADEMGMDLLALHRDYSHDADRDWAAVESEINDLREKIERLGNVNLDAIAEQDELDKRRSFLGAQVTDIELSKRQLEGLIGRINRESREMFLRTFEAVRKEFSELFRKLFGGGRADILLLDGEDVLESPIEIIARPPGKELSSLSLLSGGEKTMTALSLLFGFFRCRPSPFCVLDEVDAALDETNTERFTHLLGEFVGTSQFIVISHAKRTMAMANVLYGVTMQEPGVSTRISVRFEDVGHRLEEQLEPVGAA